MKRTIIDREKTCRQIRRKMKDKHLTAEKLATLLGVSKRAVWKYTSNTVPNTQRLFAIAQIFDCTMDELLVSKTESEDI